jgi:4-amino-4-deoxy-L-arabinose transferase-like glycosyltransferase
MSENVRYQLWILVAAACIFFTFLGAAALWDEDETLYASCAREMMDRGDWVVPWFNGRMFPDKPPLMFWLMMVGFNLFGQNEFGARFFSAVFGVGTALLTYHLGRLMFNARVGLWSGLITASSIVFTISARAATVDSALVFLTTLAVLCFVAALRVEGSAVGVQGSGFRVQGKEYEVRSTEHGAAAASRSAICNLQSAICNRHILQFCLFVILYICLGLAVLAKGPVGFLLPMAAIGLFLMIVNARQEVDETITASASRNWKTRFFGILRTFGPMNFLRSLWQLRPITGVVVVLAVALPWFILVAQRTDGAWIEQFFARYNMRPFVQPILGHSGPIWYYIPALLIGFFPWSVFLGPAAIDAVRQSGRDNPWRDGYVLLACWFGMFFVFWSISSTKLPHYVLPAYPALALLTGCFLESWITEPSRVGPSWMKNAWITTIAVGLCIVAGTVVAVRIYLPGEELIALVGLILVAGGWLCLYYSRRRHFQRAATVFAVTAVVFLTAVFGFAAQRVDRHQNAKRLMAMIRADSAAPPPICAYRFFRQSMVYYAGRPVRYFDTPEDLQAYLDSTEGGRRVYVITLDKYQREVDRKDSGKFRVLARERRFLASDEMVVLAPVEPSRTAAREASNNRQ